MAWLVTRPHGSRWERRLAIVYISPRVSVQIPRDPGAESPGASTGLHFSRHRVGAPVKTGVGGWGGACGKRAGMVHSKGLAWKVAPSRGRATLRLLTV